MKRIISAFLILILLCGMTLPVGAADNFDVFRRVKSYPAGLFTDLYEPWYADAVVSAYEYGLVRGTSDTTYSPYDSITIAQSVTFASRIRDIYSGGSGVFEQSAGEDWYMVYVEYAISAGIIEPGQFPDYTLPASRADFARIMAHALPASAYAVKNEVTLAQIPDVDAATPYAASILTLYRAGILQGNDEYGTFFPYSDIRRSEAAVMITRIVEPESRLAFSLPRLSALDFLKVLTASEGDYISDDEGCRYIYREDETDRYLLQYVPAEDALSIQLADSGSGEGYYFGVTLPNDDSPLCETRGIYGIYTEPSYGSGYLDRGTFRYDSLVTLNEYTGEATEESYMGFHSASVAMAVLQAAIDLLIPNGYTLADIGFFVLSES